MRNVVLALLFFSFSTSPVQSQLQPGFDAHEYADLLSLTYHSSSIADSTARLTTKDRYHLEYRSPEMGLMNRWSLYLRDDNVAVIDLRGTVNKAPSWLANFYAAMIPATGSLQVNDSNNFSYQFAADSKAMVHTGWTIGIAYLAPGIEEKLNQYYTSKKVRQFLIIGHSQGGALALLLRSYLEYEKQKGKVPADIVLKTYASAAPKTGNMYFAYNYDFITRGGWGYTVVNSADWVPETPLSIQQIMDLNPTNPLIHTKAVLKKQKFVLRLVGNMIYNKLERKPRKAQRKLEKYLGRTMYRKAVKKVLPQLKEPEYTHANNYMRAGSPIILMADPAYYELFPESDEKHFVHHSFAAYYYLLKKWYF